jgi:hypothetical protein
MFLARNVRPLEIEVCKSRAARRGKITKTTGRLEGGKF